MPQKKFGGKDTDRKLKTVADYLSFYTRAMPDYFQLSYLDAFAGTGKIPHTESLPLLKGTLEIDEFIKGSARRALEIPKPFNEYLFVEKSHKKAMELQDMVKNDFPLLKNNVSIFSGDANEGIREFCLKLTHKNDRAVVFLDPFGNQIGWNESIKLIAQTEKIDLWYLFPTGLGVARQISNAGRVTPESARSLDKILGCTHWREAFIAQKSTPDLFDGQRESLNKIADAKIVTAFVIERLKEIFKGGVSDMWLPLGNRGVHKYSLLFACANPSKNAKSLAKRVSKEIMTNN